MHQFKAPIADNSKAIAKIGNAELVHFNKQMLIHELIRGSLNPKARSLRGVKRPGNLYLTGSILGNCFAALAMTSYSRCHY
jgi:hypothetical protein